MALRIRKVWPAPALALCLFMAMPGAAIAHSSMVTARTQHAPGAAVKRLDASRHPIILVAASQLPMSASMVSESQLAATEASPLPPADTMQAYALALSTLGMLCLIATHRLARAF